MNEKIINALKPLNIPIKYAVRGETSIPCIVFNYNEESMGFSDDIEDVFKINLLINIYYQGNLLNVVDDVTRKLESIGFIRKVKANVFFNDNLKCWNQPIEFIKICERE